MKKPDEIALSERLVLASLRLKKMGYEVKEPENFSEVQTSASWLLRQETSPMISLGRNDFTSERFLSLFLCMNGEVVGAACAKCDNLENESFSSFVRRTSNNQYPQRGEVIRSVAPVCDDYLKGQIVYSGGLELHKDHQGKVGLVTDFVKILTILCARKWPNHTAMYAFFPERDRKRLIDHGFRVFIKNSIVWAEPEPEGRRTDHIMAIINRSQALLELAL